MLFFYLLFLLEPVQTLLQIRDRVSLDIFGQAPAYCMEVGSMSMEMWKYEYGSWNYEYGNVEVWVCDGRDSVDLSAYCSCLKPVQIPTDSRIFGLTTKNKQ